MKNGTLAFVIANNHHMIPNDFFWSYQRMMKPNGSFSVQGNSSVKCSSWNDGIYKALRLGAEWLFLMDVDQIYQLNTIPKLLEVAQKNDAKIVSVLYHLGRAPYGPVAGWTKTTEHGTSYINSMGLDWKLDYAPLGNGVVEVDWVGSGGMLIHRDVIDAVEWPPFVDVWEEGRGVRSEGHDVHFCTRAKAKGFRIFVDTSVKSSHGKFVYISQEYAQAFDDSAMVTHMDGVLHRQAQEKDYWDTLWQIEHIKGVSREGSYKETLTDIAERVPEGAKVADLGSGPGALLNHLRTEKKIDGTGYDFSEAAVEYLKTSGFGGVLADFRAYSPNGDAGSYDVVVSAHSIEHMQDDAKFVKTARELVKPDGQVIVATAWREEIQGHFEHVHQYTEGNLLDLFKKEFKDVSLFKNNRDFIVVARP